jgi:hypothetical protein
MGDERRSVTGFAGTVAAEVDAARPRVRRAGLAKGEITNSGLEAARRSAVRGREVESSLTMLTSETTLEG